VKSLSKCKIIVAAAIMLVALISIGSISAASSDQGRRLTGPFCVGKTNAGDNAGVVRSIAKTQACRSYEIRRFGLAVPHPEFPGVGSKVPGPQGGAGPAGTDGKDGIDGKNGVNGNVHVEQLENGCVKFTGSDESEATLCPTEGVAGPKGDKGDTGATGGVGPKGDPGTCDCKGEDCDDDQGDDGDHPNSGGGNGSEPDENGDDQDPGNSGDHNNGKD